MMMLSVLLVLIGLISWRRITAHQQLATTTVLSLSIVAFASVLCGMGHFYTPVVATILCAALLSWKRPLHSFSTGLTHEEVRSAILLAALSLLVMPILPSHAVGPGGLVSPRENWASVILIAGIAFGNYILLRLLGPKGMAITAFFGGLVNSRKVIVEFMLRTANNSDALGPVVFRGIMLATSAMALRNAIILAVVSHSIQVVALSIAPLGFMFLASILYWRVNPVQKEDLAVRPLQLDSPFSLSAALKFGLVFLALNVIGALAQQHFGAGSFYFVSLAGGLLSSGSAIAAAATLVRHGSLPANVGVNGVVISSLTSVLVNIPLVRHIGGTQELKRKLLLSLLMISAAGGLGVFANIVWALARVR